MKTERRSLLRSGQSSARGKVGSRGRRRLARNRQAIDVERLLDFSQQLYAHALTLQEVLRNQGQTTYEVLRPRYDRQAAQQFEVFYLPSKQP